MIGEEEQSVAKNDIRCENSDNSIRKSSDCQIEHKNEHEDQIHTKTNQGDKNSFEACTNCGITKSYILGGLDCPNCSAKIEHEVGEVQGVLSSSVNLLKQTLTIKVEEEIASTIDKKVEAIVHKHEPDVTVTNKENDDHVAKKESKNDTKLMIARLITGAVIYGSTLILSAFLQLTLALELSMYIVAYIILGADVLFRAVKNIFKGRVFDENFLMSLSTIGAFIIGEYPEAVAVMLFYQVGEFFQDLAVRRSRKSITDLMDIRPDRATVLRDGEPLDVKPEDVSIGEVIIVRPGEKIPLDGVVSSGESMLDTKALTGESVPRRAKVGDEALSGCINLSGMLTITVTKEFGESTASKIIDLVENASEKKAPTENFISTFARYYTPVVVILAVLLAVISPLAFNGEWVEWIRRSFVFLVISCPCALVISIPLTFFGGIGAASRRGVLIKGSNFLEALGHADTFVFDKTGTLTKGVFKVSDVIAADGFDNGRVIELAAKAESFSLHPIAKSVMNAYGKRIDEREVSDYTEISGYGISVVSDGKRILCGNTKLMETEHISFVPCDKVGTKVYVAEDGIFVGCIVISDEIKPDSRQAIEELKQLGIVKTVMLTGDNEQIAKDVANSVAIDEYHAGLLPAQKVECLDSLDKTKQKGKKLAFVGDGINDAPVLARADVGIAMGALGSDAAIEAADIVLMTDEPSRLPQAIKVAKETKKIVIQNIVFALAVKAAFLILGALGLAGMWIAVFGDVGVAMIAVLNAMRMLKK